MTTKKNQVTMVDDDAFRDFFVAKFCLFCGWNHTEDEPCEKEA